MLLAAILLAILIAGLMSCGGSGRIMSSSSAQSSSQAQRTFAAGTTSSKVDAANPQAAPDQAPIMPSRPNRGPRQPAAAVTVQATSGSLTHSAQVLVTVN